MDQFRTKRNRVLPALVLVMGLLVVAGLLYFGTRVVPLGDATPTPSPTVTSSAPRPTPATPGANANSIRFESQQVGGIFTINDSHWDGRTLVVNLTVSVDQGSLDYTFLSMDVETGDISEMDPPRPGDLTGGIIDAGSEVTGTVRVTKTRGDTQLLLGDAAGRNLTMLLVSG